MVFAHPDDPHGTSIVNLTKSLQEQTEIIDEWILRYIDGVECWHSRNDAQTTNHYVKFAKKWTNHDRRKQLPPKTNHHRNSENPQIRSGTIQL